VRAKARRLGIPRPDRKRLHRVDPASLEDPAPRFAGAADPASSESFRGSPLARCGTATGPVGVRGAADAPAIGTLRPSNALTESPAVTRRLRDPPVRRRADQPELPWLPNIPHNDLSAAADAAARAGAPGPEVVTVPPQIWPIVVELEGRIRAEVKLGDVVPKLADIRWVGETRRVLRDGAAILALSLRYFGGQHWKWIARDTGMHEPQLASQLTRIRLPRDFDRWKFRKTFNLECALYTLLDSGYLLRRSKEKGNYEWVNVRDLRNVHQSWETRRKWGLDEEGGGRRRETPQITLLSPRELPARRPQTPAALAGGRPNPGHSGTVGNFGYRKSQWLDAATLV
jgi:hypothetical protein